MGSIPPFSTICGCSLMVKIGGFHPSDEGSIPFIRSNGGIAQWESITLLMYWSLVQIQVPPPIWIGMQEAKAKGL